MEEKWRRRLSSVLALLLTVMLVCQSSLTVLAEEGALTEVFTDASEAESASETSDAEAAAAAR